MLHRFHRPGPLDVGASLVLEGDEVHHAVKVRRLKVNEMIELFDGKGRGVTARVTGVGRDRLEAEVVEAVSESREPTRTIELALSLIHNDRFELVLQKGTELGVSAFIPLESARSEISSPRAAGKTERWKRILLEATKQCGRHRIPDLLDVASFESALRFDGSPVILDVDLPSGSFPDPLTAVRVMVGPEGGWSPEEIAIGRTSGACFLRLGPRRLRAETAAIAAASLFGIGPIL